MACSTLGEVVLVPRGADWKFFTGGAAPGDWYQTNFNDAAWPAGPAKLGYGEGDEQTVLFANPDDAPITSYFRGSFMVTNRALLLNATLRVLGDDGFVVHLNGVEVVRRNLPDGPINADTGAESNRETGETNFIQLGLSTGRLRPGTNILAIELHQHPAGQHDASFDLELLANIPLGRPTVTITNPTDLKVVPAGPLAIETSTSDPDGHVVQVDFFANGTLLATTLREPFSIVWSNTSPGRYAITSRAYDYLFLHGDSLPVHVQIGDVTSAPRIVRGPYLQSGSPTSMVVRWRADWPSDSLVRYGTNSSALLWETAMVTNTINHEVLVTALQPDTAYFYSVGSRSDVSAGGPGYYFRTSPTNARPVRIWVIGDSGTANAAAAAVRTGYENHTGPQHTDVWMMLGDNAYGEGSDSEYQRAVFEMYPALLRNTVVWPALGNHDAGDSPDGDTSPYQQIFTLPRQGEAGGVASGNELYYSYDYANIHFICLDSYVSDRSTHGPMLTWLKEDLAATGKDWIIAYWHHPPYSWGGHNSDSEYFGIEMRERVNPILEEYGVDLVFTGHSHEYERSFLIDGHYGFSWELQPAMILDGGSGFGVNGPYRKAAGGLGSHGGVVYTVCGCSGEGGSESVEKHPAMAASLGGFGSMVIQVNGLQLTTQFLRPDGDVDDRFTIDKSASALTRPRMEIMRTAAGATISWPTSLPAFSLFTASAVPSSQWKPVAEPVARTGRRNSVFFTSGTNRFFQLQAAP